MSSKMNYIPYISSCEDIRAEMSNELQYRLSELLSDALSIIASMSR